MPICAVVGCSSRPVGPKHQKEGVEYYRIFEFPKDKKLWSKWAHFCRRQDPLPKRPGICSRHFRQEDIEQHGTKFHLVKGAIPCLFGPVLKPATKQRQTRTAAAAASAPARSTAGSVETGLAATGSAGVESTVARLATSTASVTSTTGGSATTTEATTAAGSRAAETNFFVFSRDIPVLLEDEKLTFDEFLSHSRNVTVHPWSILEDDKVLVIFKMKLSSKSRIPLCSQVLRIDKTNQAMTLERYGENIDLRLLCPFAYERESFKMTKTAISGFYNKIFAWSEANEIKTQDIFKMLTTIMRDVATTSEEDLPATIKFATEQLELVYSKTRNRNYSPAVLRFAMLIRFHSTSAYNSIRESEFLCLPSHSTLDQYVVPKRCPAITESRISELTSLASNLGEEERQVGMIFDEMACQAQLSFDSSGEIFGHALNCESGTLAESILCFMVTGLNHHFHQVLAFYPVCNPEATYLKECFMTCAKSLEMAGFKVMLSVCDNHASNRKLYSLLTGHPLDILKLEPWIKNPFRDNTVIVLMMDIVHIFKSIRNNWFRKAEWVLMDGKSRISSLLLSILVDHEKCYPVKKAFHLNQQVIKPNNYQKMRVGLAMKAVDWRTRNALLYYKNTTPERFRQNEVDPTVEFMDHTRRLFEIFNISCNKKGPIKSMDNHKVTELFLILQYFQEIVVPAGILTPETEFALNLTIHASFLILQNLFSDGVQKVFTSFFQQDPLEEYFGAQRLRSGCAYRITPQAFSETERKLSNVSVVTNRLSTNTFRGKRKSLEWDDEPLKKIKKSQIDSELAEWDEDLSLDDKEEAQGPFQDLETLITQEQSYVPLDDSLKSTILYIDGGVARKILNRTSCQACVAAIMQHVKNEEHSSDYLGMMDYSGTGLLEPDEKLFLVFHAAFSVYCRAKDNLVTLSLHDNALKGLSSVAFKVLKKNDEFISFCPNHRNSYMFGMLFSAMKTFFKAYILQENQKYAQTQAEKAESRKEKKRLKDRKLEIVIGNAK